MKKQVGFTLIELMIVVAIIGILAAVAIPAYSDYMKRSKVAEALELLGGLKTPVEEFYADKSRIPTIASIPNAKTSGKYVSVLGGPDSNGGFTASMRDTKITGVIGFKLWTNTMVWGCKAGNTAPEGGNTTAEAKYLPSSCR